MSDDIKTGSVNTGNPDNLIKSDPATGANNAGESGQKVAQGAAGDAGGIKSFEYQKSYEELELKIGSQGAELGEYRKFFKDIEPLLNKLDGQPELVQAILDGKVDTKLAQSVLEGKVKLEDAEAVTKAHDDVKKELGDKKYEQASAKDIEKLVSDKLAEFRTEVKQNLDENKSLNDFEAGINTFIANTPDFAEYAAKVEKWFEDHPSQDDIETAYLAVKGLVLAEKEKEIKETREGEDAKDLAANAAGGASQGAKVIQDRNVVDTLIKGRPNPNLF